MSESFVKFYLDTEIVPYSIVDAETGDAYPIEDEGIFETAVNLLNELYVKNENLSTANQYVYEAEADMEECQYADGYYHFDIDFSAKTGEDFKEYANYQVYLQAELLDTSSQDQTKTVENSRVRDYIVYTNAKIYTDVINPGTINSVP